MYPRSGRPLGEQAARLLGSERLAGVQAGKGYTVPDMAVKEKSVRLGDWVLARIQVCEVLESGKVLEYARRGDIGHVIELNRGHLPTIAWERTGRVCDASQGDDFDFLCGPEFGKRPT